MALDDAVLQEAIFGLGSAQRFTQDSPVLPDVWWAFGQQPPPGQRREGLLLTPHRHGSTSELVRAVRNQLPPAGTMAVAPDVGLTYNEAYVKGEFTFDELIACLLPLTLWY